MKRFCLNMRKWDWGETWRTPDDNPGHATKTKLPIFHFHKKSQSPKTRKWKWEKHGISFFLFPLLFLLLFSQCKEDPIDPDVFGSLTGQVLFDADNSPIEDAIISTTPATSIVQSGADGSFVFESIKVGSYTIRAEAPDLVSAVQTITIVEDENSSVVILMSEPTVDNQPPGTPQIISPYDGATGQAVKNLELNWETIDPDEDDILTYDLCIFNGNSNSDTLKFFDLTENKININDLRYGSTYFWQISVSDGTADSVFSEVWRFTTEDFPTHRFVFSRIFDDVYEIYSSNISGEFYQLTFDGSNFRPRISPFGDRIAYVHANFPIWQLHSMNRDGTNQMDIELPVPIAGDNPFQLDFCWSPDGSQILYMNEERLFKINIDGTGHELIAELNNEEFIEVDWNGPTGKIAARTVGDMPYNSRILLYEEDGNFIEEIIPDVPGSIGGPSFSIDGEHILYTRDTSGIEFPDGRQLASHIFLHEISTGNEIDLSHNKPLGFNDLDARFSPNGALVIFVHTNNFPNSQKDIFVMTIEGEGRTLLFENSEMPDWWE